MMTESLLSSDKKENTTAQKQLRVVLADDHPLARKGISALLKLFGKVEIVGEAEDGKEAVEKCRELSPDVAILDAMMPVMSGLEATKAIRATMPSVRILILTGYEDEGFLFEIMKAGASGYLLKTADGEELDEAIHAVSRGEQYFSTPISKLIQKGYVKRAQASLDRADKRIATLTKRETEVLRFIAEGMTNQQISDKLFISPRTVDTHRTNLMRKLDIHDVALLVRYAIEHGLVESKGTRSF